MNRPPVAARALLWLLLPPKLYEVIAGDLEEEWAALPGRPVRRSLTFWALALRSIADCWRERLRGGRRERTRQYDSQGGVGMGSVLQDVRYAIRAMFRTPGFTVPAVLTLAVGIGANTAVFSIVNVVAIQPLPYQDPSRVAFVLGTDTESGDLRFNLRVADYLDIARDARSFEYVAAYTYLSANISGGDVPDRVQAYRVTANTFDMLGVTATLGRTFNAEDMAPGSPRLAVISDGLWRRRFGADPAVVGRTIVVNGDAHEIIGVMPRRFEYPVFNFKGELWTPWRIETESAFADRATSGSATVVARFNEKVEPAEAAAELRTIMSRLAADHPATNATLGARLVEMGRLDDEQAGAAILVPTTAVGLVLLLACANVANLLLARGVSRAREIGVRAAVGASRWRIFRQLLLESLLLASGGAAAGCALAYLALDALRGALPEAILTTMPNVDQLGIDLTTLAFTIGIGLLTTLGCGLLPAWRATRAQLIDALKEGAASGGTRGTRRLRTALMVGEVALATLLLAGAVLLGRSYASLQKVSPGFAAAGLLTMTISIEEERYPTPMRRRQFYQDVSERIAALPAVRSVGAVNVLPFSTYDRGTRFVIDGAPAPARGREPATAFRIVTPGYFSTMAIPQVAGRLFDARDRASSPPVGMINGIFARRHFGDGEAIGRRIRLGDAASTSPWITIVGVVGDVHHSQLTQAPAPELYVPLAQSGPPMMMFAIRTEGPVEDLVGSVRNAVLEVDPVQPIYHVKPMAQLVADAMLPQRMSTTLMAVFSAMALMLSAIGVYGVMSYGVTQQMAEFGLRLALGATPVGLVAWVLKRCAAMVAVGVVIGTAAAFLVSGVLASQLYGVDPTDPVTYALAAVTLAAVGMGAGTIPALRASSAEPVSALRTE